MSEAASTEASPRRRVASIAELAGQRASDPKSAAEQRAVYFNTGNAFDVKLPPVPDASFVDEPALALSPDTPTGLIDCDRSALLHSPFPATTPLILARYARINAGDRLETEFRASGVMVYVIAGSGSTHCAGETVHWTAGDLLVMPGGVAACHRAGTDPAVLWIVTNEPQLAFERLRPPAPGDAPTELVQFTGREIERQIDLLYRVGRSEDIAGSALIFSSTLQEASRNVLPTLTAAMNSLPPGATQRPHRHNSVAVSLVVQGERCHSVVDGQRKDWSPWATTVTPATRVHSHHNGGDRRALFLIVQDGGLYYHTRALGFEFAES